MAQPFALHKNSFCTMQYIAMAFLCTLFSSASNAQTLFFDNLNETTWASPQDEADSTFIWHNQIPLSKVTVPTDSLHENLLLWNFQNGMLSIKHFNANTHQITHVHNFLYSVTEDSLIKIEPSDGAPLYYEVGIVSSGYYAYLMKPKKRKANIRKEKN